MSSATSNRLQVSLFQLKHFALPHATNSVNLQSQPLSNEEKNIGEISFDAQAEIGFFNAKNYKRKEIIKINHNF